MHLIAARRRVRAAIAGLVLPLFLVVPGAAHAVVNGQLDGNAHPNVGLIAAFDANGGGFDCTGALVAPSTVLTAAHCAVDDPASPPIVRYVVSFDSKVPGEADGGDRVIPNGIEGTPDPDPAYVFRITSQGAGGSAAFFRNEAVDVALIHLDQPAASVFPGITPVHIAGAGTLDAIKNGSKPSLLQVGYGATRSGPPGQPSSFSFDAIRRDSEFPLRQLRGDLFFANTNPNDANGYGSPCFGDSGSPLFYNGNEAGVNAFVGGPCNNVVGGPRLDAGPARAFLKSRGIVP